jgi:hypothetical protein
VAFAGKEPMLYEFGQGLACDGFHLPLCAQLLLRLPNQPKLRLPQ